MSSPVHAPGEAPNLVDAVPVPGLNDADEVRGPLEGPAQLAEAVEAHPSPGQDDVAQGIVVEEERRVLVIDFGE